MEALESELTCPVCLDLFEDPLQLACLHNLCRKCADVLDSHTRKTEGARGGAGVGKEEPVRARLKDEAKLTCPTCRREIPLDDRGVESLSRNMVLQNIVDRFREARDRDKTPEVLPCQMCEVDPQPAVKVCVNCDIAYCEACLLTFHPARGPLARHTLVLPGQQPGKAEPKVVMCSAHTDEKVNLYCKVDEMPVCALCKLVGTHQDHEVAALADAYKEKKDILIEEVAGLKDRNKEISDFVTGMRETCVKVQEQNKKWKDKLVQGIERLEEILKERKMVLEKALSEEEGQKLKLLNSEISKKEEDLQKAWTVVAYVEEVLKEKNQSFFLQAVKSTRERVKENHNRDALIAPANWVFKGFDFKGQTEALKALDEKVLSTSWEQCVQNLSASSYLDSPYGSKKLVDGHASSYWYSRSSPQSQHWLRLQLKPGVQVRTLHLSLVPQPVGKWTEKHKPQKVTVLAGDDYNNMVDLETVHVTKEQREITIYTETEKSFLQLTFEMKTPSACIASQLSIVGSKWKE